MRQSDPKKTKYGRLLENVSGGSTKLTAAELDKLGRPHCCLISNSHWAMILWEYILSFGTTIQLVILPLLWAFEDLFTPAVQIILYILYLMWLVELIFNFIRPHPSLSKPYP